MTALVLDFNPEIGCAGVAAITAAATGGGLHGYGVDRPALSDADMAARRWLKTRMESAGLSGVQVNTDPNPTLSVGLPPNSNYASPS